MKKPLRVLMVEDSEDDVLLEIRALKKGGYEPEYERVETAEAMRTTLREKTWDIILCDYKMPQFNGLAAIALLKETGIDIPLIIISGTIGEEKAADCMRYGAHDYIMKNNLPRLVPAIERELQDAESRSKRRQAEEAVQSNEARLRAILDATPFPIALVDLQDNSIDYWSHSAFTLFGHTAPTAPEWYQIAYPDPDYRREVIDRWKASLEIARESHQPVNAGEYRVTCRDGSVRICELYATFLADRLIVTFNDITDRKRSETELVESKALTEAVVENVPLMIFLKESTDLRFVIFNRAGEELLGYDRKSLLGKNNLDLFPPEQAAHFMAKDREVLDGEAGMLDIPEEPILTAKKGERLLHTRKVCIRGPDGATKFLLGISEDITERKQVEEALKESENKYRLLADNVSDVIFVLDMNLKYTYVSPSVEILRGYKPEEVLKHSPEKTLTPSSWDQAVRTLSEVMELEKSGNRKISESRTIELEMWRKDGTTVWTEVKFSFIRDQGQRPVGVLGVTRDITDRRKAEEELQQTFDRLRKSINATIQVMVTAVEVRDPYTSGHQLRSADLARTIATEMELPPNIIDGIRMAGSIHDIGKLSVPAEILSKPTKLTNLEFSLIKEHARAGYEMLKDVESPWPLAEIVYQHHERMDGSGYPRNLKGDEILMEARIMAVADVVESMASHRPYRPALGIDAALNEIENNRGTHYDNTVVDACLRLFREKGFQLAVA